MPLKSRVVQEFIISKNKLQLEKRYDLGASSLDILTS